MGQGSNTKPERISEAEHAVMEVLWDRNPATAADVSDALPQPCVPTRPPLNRSSVGCWN